MANYSFLHIEHTRDGTPIAILESLADCSYERFDLSSIRRRIENLRRHNEDYDEEIKARDAILVAMTEKPEQKSTRIVRDQLADLIAGGDLGGYTHNWRVEIIFPNRYESQDRRDVIQKIAGFVRDGIMEGSFPTWTVTVSRSIDLDREID